MIIALIGNDGSGKTTISKELARLFSDIGFKVHYKHEYDYAILKFLFKAGGKQRIEKARQEMLVDKKKSKKFRIWPFLVWFDTFLQHVYYSLFKRNSIIILDRYPYDHYISFGYLDALTKFSEWLYLHFPKPDLVVLLWVEPEIAYERKKATHTYQVSFYEMQTGKYLELAKILGINAINTNCTLDSTIGKILDLTVTSDSQLGKEIPRRALQNKMYFEVLAKRPTDFFSRTVKSFEERKRKFAQTISFLKELFSNAGIREFVIFKDYDEYTWIGNDVDVLIDKNDFVKVIRALEQMKNDAATQSKMRWKISKSHSQAVDVLHDDLLGIDVHTAIGWRGIDLLTLDEIIDEKVTKTKFGVEYPSVKPALDALIYAFSHVFEKGFVTRLEYQMIEKHLEEFDRFQISSSIKPYIELFKMKPARDYPYFLPFSVRLESYSRIAKERKMARVASLTFRIMAMQLFWKVRFQAKKVLPFEIRQYESQ